MVSKELSVKLDVAGLPEVVAILDRLKADLQVYRDYYGTSPAQVKHLSECNVCAVLPPQLPEYCPDYPSE